MAAFIQKLFQKRSTSATSPDTHKKSRAQTSRQEAPQNGETDNGQGVIDQQRSALSEPGSPQETLADLAVDGLAVDIRLGAARQLTDRALLQKVQKASRGRDKGVYQHVRHQLQELRQREDEALATREAIAQLIRQAGELASTSDTNLYEARVQKLEQQWQSLEPSADNDARAQALAALHECRQRAREMEVERQRAQQQQARKVQRQETLSLLEETLQDLAKAPPTVNALPSLDALQRTQENRWLEATRDTEVARQEQKQYEQLMLKLRGAVNALRRLGQHYADIEALMGAGEPSPEQARALLETLDWPEDLARPDALQQLTRAARVRVPETQPPESRAAEQAKLDQLESVIATLEEALEANQLKESRQHLKQAQGVLRQLPGKAAGRYRARLQRLGGQVRELGDWRGFATEPKQTALCEQMEYLAEQPMDPEAKASRIQELQQEWRDLGGSSDRSLWQRFRSASDKAFEPCRAYFEARSDLKKVHLEKRHNICHELERYLEATDWEQVDWKAAEQIEKTARQEWREAWPVEFRDNRTVQKTFDRLMDTLSRHLDEERVRNEARKQAIVDRARELVAHEPLTEAMDEAKALQKQWQQVGITRQREDRKLWKAFRSACDAIFARRDEQRHQRLQQTGDADQTASEVLTQARAWLETGNDETAEASELLSRLNAAGNTPVSAPMGQQLRDTTRQIEDRLTHRRERANTRQWQQWIGQRQSGELDTTSLPEHWQRLQHRAALTDPRQLVVLAEILSGQPSPESDQSLRMELQVRRLKEGLENGQEVAGASLEALVARWCLELPADNLTPGLTERFQRALELP